MKVTNTIPARYHMLFWLCYFLFNVIRWGSYFDDYLYSLKSNLIEFPIHIIIVYVNIYYLIPRYILRKKYWTYVGLLSLILFGVYIVRTSLNYLLVTKEIWPEAEVPATFFELNHLIAVILGELYVIGFVTSIKLVIDWSLEKKRNEDLAKLQMSTELKYLRTQIKPHFFFNTLNNLYALSLKQSNNVPRLILKLSEMMQYILYDVKSSKAELIEEINHINNYIDIERLRFEDQIDCQVDITGNIEDVKVPPLLLLSFVENAFKHGLRDNDKLILKMSFNVNDSGYLEFNIINNVNTTVSKTSKTGIGNENAERRLKLLFSNNYSLTTKLEDGNYHLYLKIPVE